MQYIMPHHKSKAALLPAPYTQIVTNNLLLVSRIHPKDKASVLFGSGRFDVQHYTLTGTSYLEFLRQT